MYGETRLHLHSISRLIYGFIGSEIIHGFIGSEIIHGFIGSEIIHGFIESVLENRMIDYGSSYRR